MTKSYHFSHGPKLSVQCTFSKGALVQSTLTFADVFECQLHGDVEKGLKEELLSFLEAYGGKKAASVELCLDELSPFRQKVLQALSSVGIGKTASYGQLAQMIGKPQAARAVGMACHHNPYPLFIPCHRVIASSGKIGGFAYDIKMKQLLLDFEICHCFFSGASRMISS